MSMLTILKYFLLTGIDGRKAIQRVAQPQTEGLRSLGGLGQHLNKQKKHSFREMRNGWFFAFVYTDALLATSKVLYYCNVCSKICVKEEIKI